MKKRIIFALAILAMFALAIAAYAYTSAAPAPSAAASCCKKGDSCPIKTKGHDEKGEHAKMSCCKGHHGSDHAGAEGKACCDCCGDSCPMKKQGDARVTTAATSEEGKSCCDNCDCCKAKPTSAA